MPRYEYRCRDCRTATVETRAVEDREPGPPCLICGEGMERVYTAPQVWQPTAARTFGGAS